MSNLREINVPISEYDLEEFKDVVYMNSSFNWVFETKDGESIQVNFMNEEELEQRSN